MAGIDEVMERLVTDAGFRSALARDPASALAGYELTREDVQLLASRLDDGDDEERAVEQRTSKSALLALLSSFAEPGGSPAGSHPDDNDVLAWSWGTSQQDAGDAGGGVPIVGDWDGDGAASAASGDGTTVQTEMLSMDLRGGHPGLTPVAGNPPDDGVDELTQKVAPADETIHVYGYSGAEADPVAPVSGTPPDDGVDAGIDAVGAEPGTNAGDGPGHQGWVELQSFGQAVHQPGGGGGAAEVDLSDLVVTSVQTGGSGQDEAVGTPPGVDELTQKVMPEGDTQAVEIELENAQITSFSFSGTGGDTDEPVITGQLPNGVDEPPQEEHTGLKVPGSDLTEPTDAEVEDDLPMMPNPAAHLGQLAGDGGLDPVPGDDVSGIQPQPFHETDAAMGDAGIDPVPGEEDGIIISQPEGVQRQTDDVPSLPGVDDEPGGLPGVDDGPSHLPDVDDGLVSELPGVDDPVSSSAGGGDGGSADQLELDGITGPETLGPVREPSPGGPVPIPYPTTADADDVLDIEDA